MSSDFRTKQIQTKQIISSGSLGSGFGGARLVIYPIEAQGIPFNTGIIDQNIFNTGSLDGQDIFLYISGGVGEKNSNTRSATVFGGDTMVSGVLYTDNILTTDDVSSLTSSFVGVMGAGGVDISNSEYVVVNGSGVVNVSDCSAVNVGASGFVEVSSSFLNAVFASSNATIKNSDYSSTISTQNTTISGTQNSSIVASTDAHLIDRTTSPLGDSNLIAASTATYIYYNAPNNTILSSDGAIISGSYQVSSSTSTNLIGAAKNAEIINGNRNILLASQDSTILNTNSSVLIGGTQNILSGSVGDFNNNIISANSIIGGNVNLIEGNTTESSILGGFSNIITSSVKTFIANSATSSVITVSQGTILGSDTTTITNGEKLFVAAAVLSTLSCSIQGSNNTLRNSAVIAGTENIIISNDDQVNDSVLIGGCDGTVVSNSYSAVVLGSRSSVVENGETIAVIGSIGSTTSGSTKSSIISSRNSSILQNGTPANSRYKSIIASDVSLILGPGEHATIIGSVSSIITGSVYNSSRNNTIIGTQDALIEQSTYSTILGGYNSTLIAGDSSGILFSKNSSITSSNSSIILGGQDNSVVLSDYVTLIGSGLVANGYSNTIILGGTDFQTIVSGVLIVSGGLTGSLQKTFDGNDYIIAGPNITITTNSLGQIEITGSSPGSDPNVSYVVLGLTASLPNERLLIAGPGITITDYGINNNVAISSSLVVSGTWIEGSPSPRLRTSASVAIGSDSSFAQEITGSAFFYVSGSKFDQTKISLFGGDLHVNGNLVQELSTSKNIIKVTNQVATIASNTNTLTQSNQTVIIAGDSNIIDKTRKSVVIAGDSNLFYDNINGFGKSAVIAGDGNTITGKGASQGTWSAVIAGRNNIFNSSSQTSAISSLTCTFDNGTLNSAIGTTTAFFQGDTLQCVAVASDFPIMSGGITYGTRQSAIVGGTTQAMKDVYHSVMLGGASNLLEQSSYAVTVGGSQNSISGSDLGTTGFGNTIIGGSNNQILGSMDHSSIIASAYSTISSSLVPDATRCSVIIGSLTSSMNSSYNSIIVGGKFNRITSLSGTILIGGGLSSSLNNTIILGGSGYKTIVSGGLTGSLQRTIGNLAYITGGANINVNTNSLGQIEISSSNGYKHFTTFKTANYTATVNERLIYISASNTVTMSLPTNPSEGQSLIFKDKAGNSLVNNIIISSSNSTIDGSSTFVLNINYGSVEVVYMSSSTPAEWGVI